MMDPFGCFTVDGAYKTGMDPNDITYKLKTSEEIIDLSDYDGADTVANEFHMSFQSSGQPIDLSKVEALIVNDISISIKQEK